MFIKIWRTSSFCWIVGHCLVVDQERYIVRYWAKVIALLNIWTQCYLLIYSITYLLTYSWSRVLIVKLTGFQLVKKFPAFYGTQRFITAFTRARQLSLSSARSIQSNPPQPTCWTSILILSSNLCLGLPSGLFSSGVPPKLYTHKSVISPIRAIWPSHFILLNLKNRTFLGKGYRSLSMMQCISSL